MWMTSNIVVGGCDGRRFDRVSLPRSRLVRSMMMVVMCSWSSTIRYSGRERDGAASMTAEAWSFPPTFPVGGVMVVAHGRPSLTTLGKNRWGGRGGSRPADPVSGSDATFLSSPPGPYSPGSSIPLSTQHRSSTTTQLSAVASPTGNSASSLSTQHPPSSPPPSPWAERLLQRPYVQREFGGLSYWDTFSVATGKTAKEGATSSFPLHHHHRVIFILGGPGAGKGTQCALLQEHYASSVVHLSVGQLLREAAATAAESDHPAASSAASEDDPEQKKVGELIRQALAQGQIVPVHISLQLLQRAMQQAALVKGPQTFFLVDGFPRNWDNVQGWCQVMTTTTADRPPSVGVPESQEEPPTPQTSSCSKSFLASVLVYHCPLAVLEDRILQRAASSGRSDDNLASMQKRFQTFAQETVPVIDWLRDISSAADPPAPWWVQDLAGNQPLEQVWSSTQAVMNELLRHDVLTANAALLRAVATGDAALYQSLSDAAWFEAHNGVASKLPAEQVMQRQEGPPVADSDLEQATTVHEAQVEFLSGRQALVTYKRRMPLEGPWVREKRIWTHQGLLGWRQVHFERAPCDP